MLEQGIAKLKQHNLDVNLAKYLYKYLDNKDEFLKGIDRLINGEAVQYIVGNVNFYGFTINVNPNVLIPRFETEELVNKTLEYLKKYFNSNIDIIDIGTGSGCIAIILKKLLPNSHVTAIDISNKALEIAKENAKINEVEITFGLSDIFSSVEGKFDLLISNPPYIDYNDQDVMEVVKNNEPKIALYAANEGLEFYEKILKEAIKYLKEKNMIALEIGMGQGKKIELLAKRYFPNSIVKIEKDMQEKERFVFIFNF